VQNEKGVPVLGLAVGFNQCPMVELLLAQGARVTDTDSQGNTALHYAAGYGRREAAEILLRAGADMATCNGQGQTPLDAAQVNSEVRISGCWIPVCGVSRGVV
jgi:ankyrin repeat protein